jgi:hypothetical protein
MYGTFEHTLTLGEERQISEQRRKFIGRLGWPTPEDWESFVLSHAELLRELSQAQPRQVNTVSGPNGLQVLA